MKTAESGWAERTQSRDILAVTVWKTTDESTETEVDERRVQHSTQVLVCLSTKMERQKLVSMQVEYGKKREGILQPQTCLDIALG